MYAYTLTYCTHEHSQCIDIRYTFFQCQFQRKACIQESEIACFSKWRAVAQINFQCEPLTYGIAVQIQAHIRWFMYHATFVCRLLNSRPLQKWLPVSLKCGDIRIATRFHSMVRWHRQVWFVIGHKYLVLSISSARNDAAGETKTLARFIQLFKVIIALAYNTFGGRHHCLFFTTWRIC